MKDELYHYGVKGQKWGKRQYQNPDGTWTELGKERRRVGKNKLQKEDNTGDTADNIEIGLTALFALSPFIYSAVEKATLSKEKAISSLSDISYKDKQSSYSPKALKLAAKHGFKVKTVPSTIEEDVERTNPHYTEGDNYKMNCSKCVTAYAYRRLGLDVEANGVNTRTIAEGGLPNEEMTEVFGIDWNHYSKGVKLRPHKTKNPYADAIAEEINKSYKDAERAIGFIHVEAPIANSAHVFSFEKIGNKVVLVDPQNGSIYDPNAVEDTVKGTLNRIIDVYMPQNIYKPVIWYERVDDKLVDSSILDRYIR